VVVDLMDAALEPRAWVRDAAGRTRIHHRPRPLLPARQNRRPLALALGVGGAGIDFDLLLPEGARLQVDVGFREIEGRRQPDRTDFVISIAEDGAFHPLHSQRVTFGPRNRGQAWRPIQVDLSQFGGKRVKLRLEAVAAPWRKGARFAFWGSPRISVSPANGPAES